jgi:uncharacterized protein Yka (UPF0111/DUF47 family)
MRHWFLPEAPDLLGLLTRQGEVTIEGLDALSAWTKGDQAQGERVRHLEHLGDVANRDVLSAVKSAFVTPIGPEDVYEISERLDAVLNAAKDLVREAELLDMAPDPPMTEMVAVVASGARQLVQAFPNLASDPDRATECADASIHEQRALEHIYRRAMSALLDSDDLHEITGRRELYRRCARMGDHMEGVAHRVWYAVVKQA